MIMMRTTREVAELLGINPDLINTRCARHPKDIWSDWVGNRRAWTPTQIVQAAKHFKVDVPEVISRELQDIRRRAK